MATGKLREGGNFGTHDVTICGEVVASCLCELTEISSRPLSETLCCTRVLKCRLGDKIKKHDLDATTDSAEKGESGEDKGELSGLSSVCLSLSPQPLPLGSSFACSAETAVGRLLGGKISPELLRNAGLGSSSD